MTLPTEADRRDGRAPFAFLAFLAVMTSVVAMTIDAILPTLDAISADLAFADPSDRHWLVMAVFIGMALSQPVFGALADSLGRRPAALLGWGLHGVGSVVCLAAEGEAAMLLGRFLQGAGAGGPRVVAAAIIRDLYEGRPMARILSLVMTIFMLVPILAPLMGQGVEALAGWRAIFWLYLTLALGAALWYLLGVPETLAPEHRRPLSLRPMAAAFWEVITNRVAMCYTASAACAFGPFLLFIATAQQVLEESYALGPWFPAAFALLASAFALSSFLNSRLVMALGMRRLSLLAGLGLLASGVLGTALTLALGPLPPLWAFLATMAAVFFSIAVLFANFNALALQPLGHIAGTASAVVMSLAALGASGIALAVAARFEGTPLPLFLGVLGTAGLALAFMALAERRVP